MDKDDDYRREAEDARVLAAKAKNPDDRAAWLRISQSWLDLIYKPHPGQQRSPEKPRRVE
jgi:hypothetical protein